MKIEDFEKELQAIDPDLSIKPNPSHKAFPELEKLASIHYRGESMFTIPNYDIYDQVNQGYGADVMSDGRFFVHRTRLQALEMVKIKLAQINNDPDYADAFFGHGNYSANELKKVTESGPELVEEVKGDLESFEGQSISDNQLLK